MALPVHEARGGGCEKTWKTTEGGAGWAALAEARGCARIGLSCAAGRRAFYRQCGFEEEVAAVAQGLVDVVGRRACSDSVGTALTAKLDGLQAAIAELPSTLLLSANTDVLLLAYVSYS